MTMSSAKSSIVRKHIRMDSVKLKRLQKALNCKTETETIVRAVDMVLAEDDRIRRAERAYRKWLRDA